MDFNLFLTIAVQNFISPIPCEFQFIENDPYYPQSVLERVDLKKLGMPTTLAPHDLFECEDNFGGVESDVGGFESFT